MVSRAYADHRHHDYLGRQALCRPHRHRGLLWRSTDPALTAVQIFTSTGELLTKFAHVAANPPDVNVLPGPSVARISLHALNCAGQRDDPRVVANLFDGVNRTCDPRHMWLAPFCRGTDHTISITFAAHATIAMVARVSARPVLTAPDSRVELQRVAHPQLPRRAGRDDASQRAADLQGTGAAVVAAT